MYQVKFIDQNGEHQILHAICSTMYEVVDI